MLLFCLISSQVTLTQYSFCLFCFSVDGDPMISPTEDKENTNHNAPPQDRDRKQMIMSMDMELWEVCNFRIAFKK